MYDVIVIGGGPAGLTAALYSLRAEKRVLVLEGNGFGGQIVYAQTVDNFPGVPNMNGAAFAEKLLEQVMAAGGDVEFENVTKLIDGEEKTVITDYHEYKAKSVIIATGVKHRHLGVEGEEEHIGKGVSFCAVCDGAFFRGRTVAVVGGGNTAVEDAIYLADMAEKVYLIHRRDEFRAENAVVNALHEKKNVELVLNSVVSKINGDEFVNGIEVSDVKTNEKREIKVNGVFVAIGQIPQNEIFKGIVDLDSDGYVIAGEDCKTSAKGIFTAGDCRTKSIRQLTTAVGDGTVAALNTL